MIGDWFEHGKVERLNETEYLAGLMAGDYDSRV